MTKIIGQAALFSEHDNPMQLRVSELPISVIESGRYTSGRRQKGTHDEQSSRTEYSHFPLNALALCVELFLRDSTKVFDPFAGWGERERGVVGAGKSYYGFDTSEDAVSASLGGVRLGDSRVEAYPQFDGLLTCPPYWNLEMYSGNGLHSIPTWDGFLKSYRSVLRKCAFAASPGSTFCILVGDWRSNGILYDLTHSTRVILYDAGMIPWDEVICSRASNTKIKIMIPQATRCGYTVKVHETLLVFRKSGR